MFLSVSKHMYFKKFFNLYLKCFKNQFTNYYVSNNDLKLKQLSILYNFQFSPSACSPIDSKITDKLGFFKIKNRKQ